MRSKNRLFIRCDDIFIDKLEAMCKVDKKTKSALIRDAVYEKYNKNREYDKMYWNLIDSKQHEI